MSNIVRIASIPASASARFDRLLTAQQYTARAAQKVRSVTRRTAFPHFSKAPAFIASVPNVAPDQTSGDEKTPRGRRRR